MHRRLALSAALAATFVVLGAFAASATATYPASDNAISVVGGDTDIAVGDAVDINAATFEAGSDVTFTVEGPSALTSGKGGTALVPVEESGDCSTESTCVRVADDDGVATATVGFSEAGKHTITATGTDRAGAPLTVTATVTVADDAAADDPDEGSQDPDSGGLAKTGSDLIRYGLIGAAFVAVGAIIVVTFRRRSSTPPPAA